MHLPDTLEDTKREHEAFLFFANMILFSRPPLKIPLMDTALPDDSSPHSLFFGPNSHTLLVSFQNFSDAVLFTQ